MKKLHLLLAMFLMACLYSREARAQDELSIEYAWGGCDTLASLFFVLEEDYEPGMMLVSYWGDGDSTTYDVTEYSEGIGACYTYHDYSSTGTFTVRAVLYNAALEFVDTFQYIHEVTCVSIRGNLYRVMDSDCSFDPGTEPLTTATYDLELRKDGVPVDTFTGIYGYFCHSITSPDFSATYSLRPLNAYGFILSCPGSGSYSFMLGDITDGTQFDFGFECDPEISDNDLSTIMSGLYRTTGASYLTIGFGNSGCYTTDAKFTLNIDPEFKYNSALPEADFVSTDSLTAIWELPAFVGTDYIMVNLLPADTPDVGSIACSNGRIAAWDGTYSGDIDTSNNTFIFCDSVRAAMDPNIKTVAPFGEIAAGELLTYTIQFENLGNDTAFNIHIIDTLSSNVDAATFQLLSSTHMVNTIETEYSGTKIIKFDFPNIKLPDASAPNYNKGSVTYSVKAKTSLEPLDVIDNTAYIYFDINPAVVTNTVTNFIPDPSSLKQFSKEDGISIFPNPAEDRITIINEKGKYHQVLIVNTLGQSLQAGNLKKGNNVVSIQSLPAGVYYVVFIGKEDMRTTKIVKR